MAPPARPVPRLLGAQVRRVCTFEPLLAHAHMHHRDHPCACVPMPCAQRPLGPLLPLRRHANCSRWVDARYRVCANLSEEEAGDFNVMLRDGTWAAQRFTSLQPAGSLEGAFLHLQRWKSVFKKMRYGSAQVRACVLRAWCVHGTYVISGCHAHRCRGYGAVPSSASPRAASRRSTSITPTSGAPARRRRKRPRRRMRRPRRPRRRRRPHRRKGGWTRQRG